MVHSEERDVTGSIVTVSSSTLKEVPAPNLVAQLKGRVAGVDIVSNSSTPAVPDKSAYEVIEHLQLHKHKVMHWTNHCL